MSGCPVVTGSVLTVATRAPADPDGVDQTRCSARPEVAEVIVVSCPDDQVKFNARLLASVIEVIP